jgi:hypothetical protein
VTCRRILRVRRPVLVWNWRSLDPDIEAGIMLIMSERLGNTCSRDVLPRRKALAGNAECSAFRGKVDMQYGGQ